MIPYDIESGKKKRVLRKFRKKERSWKRLRKNQARDFEINGVRKRVAELITRPILVREDRNSPFMKGE